MFVAFASVNRSDVTGLKARWRAKQRTLSSKLMWSDDCFSARIDHAADHSLAVGDVITAVGVARLDHLDTLDGREARTTSGPSLKDIVSTCDETHSFEFKRMIGEFALVLWNRKKRELIAVRDPLGVMPLFYQAGNNDIWVADRLEGFERRGTYDQEFIADFIASRGCYFDRTIWSNILPLPPGAMLVWRDGRVQLHRYWSPETLEPLERMELNEAGCEFRRLLESAVLRCLNPGTQTWAHLSGGLDSSSIVSTAAVLNERGVTDKRLGGTITLTDSLGNADESDFANAVVRRFSLHNERIADDWPWRTDEAPPPLTDQPARDYPFYARDRLTARIIKDYGGTALLSGIGPDHYLPVTSYHMPDLIWTGRFGEGARELYRWTIATRDSFWRVTFRHMLAPLLAPRWYALREVHGSEVPAWITASFAARCDFHYRLAAQHDPGKRGRFYQSASRRSVSRIACWLPSWFDLPGINTRHPFLYLPLVEFCLRLSYRLRTDIYQSKPVLRAAMKGVLPEKVRQRFSKGVLQPRICWALGQERQQLSRLLAASVLADLGCIEPKRALVEVDSHATGVGGNPGFLYAMLSLETWLSTRSGRCGV